MKLLEQASTPCIEIILLGNEQCPCFISSSVKSLVKVQFVKISMKCHPRSAVMLSPCHLFWLLMTFSQRCVWRNWRLCFDQLPPNVRSICFASNSFSCHQKPGPGQHCSWRFASGRTFFSAAAEQPLSGAFLLQHLPVSTMGAGAGRKDTGTTSLVEQ